MNLNWNALVAKMKVTGEFDPDGLEADSLEHDYNEGRTVIRTYGSRITAHASVGGGGYFPWYPEYEIRRIYVASGANGKGKGREIVTELMERFTRIELGLPRKVPTFFLISKNPAVWHIAKSLDFAAVTIHSMPYVVDWANRGGLYYRLPESARCDEPWKLKEPQRWLYLK
ncbi:MAG: GNAT family N-acetyltransferase [bacterium]|nr:GNAT family N-acetyltransferase [bacterium]